MTETTKETPKNPLETEPYQKLKYWRGIYPIGASSKADVHLDQYMTDSAGTAGTVIEIRVYLKSGLVRVTVDDAYVPGTKQQSKKSAHRVGHIWISGGSGAEIES